MLDNGRGEFLLRLPLRSDATATLVEFLLRTIFLDGTAAARTHTPGDSSLFSHRHTTAVLGDG